MSWIRIRCLKTACRHTATLDHSRLVASSIMRTRAPSQESLYINSLLAQVVLSSIWHANALASLVVHRPDASLREARRPKPPPNDQLFRGPFSKPPEAAPLVAKSFADAHICLAKSHIHCRKMTFLSEKAFRQ